MLKNIHMLVQLPLQILAGQYSFCRFQLHAGLPNAGLAYAGFNLHKRIFQPIKNK